MTVYQSLSSIGRQQNWTQSSRYGLTRAEQRGRSLSSHELPSVSPLVRPGRPLAVSAAGALLPRAQLAALQATLGRAAPQAGRPQPVRLPGSSSPGQGSAFGPAECHWAPGGPFPRPVWVPLYGSPCPANWCHLQTWSNPPTSVIFLKAPVLLSVPHLNFNFYLLRT